MDYMRTVDRNWPVLTRLMRGHATVYRATHGLIGHRIPGVPEMLLLDHVGAKSGTRRTERQIPLLVLTPR
jgi:F420H(2)-dependent quinone reductase